MQFQTLGEAHWDYYTGSHSTGVEIPEFEEAELSSSNVQYKEMDKGNGLLKWLNISGEHEITQKAVERPDMFCSRIDVALDVILDCTDIEELFKNEGRDFSAVKFMRHNKYVSSSGRTVYFGSGDKQLRIYEKGKQLELVGYEGWIRFEFQLKGIVARQALDTTVQPSELFEQLQKRYLRDSLSLRESAGDLKFNRPESLDKRRYWERTAKPYLLNNFSKEELREMLLPIIFQQKNRTL